MSAAAAAASSPSSSVFTSLSLPIAISIAVVLLLLLSAILALYFYCRPSLRHPPPRSSPAAASAGGVVLPRIIFVAEDDDDDGGDPAAADGRSPSPGLDPAAISSYPKFPYAGAKSGGDTGCPICLCEYKEGEMLRMIPDCRHCFHLLCVDVWLRLNASCPLCRTSPLPTPVSTPISTPLSELVPLSQFAADRRRR